MVVTEVVGYADSQMNLSLSALRERKSFEGMMTRAVIQSPKVHLLVYRSYLRVLPQACGMIETTSDARYIQCREDSLSEKDEWNSSVFLSLIV